jgi:hypothetical protein
MNQRIYHGSITPTHLASALVSHFHRGNWRVQQFGDNNKAVVQIATHSRPASGGQTAISIILQKADDGVVVQVGQQAWLGVAASLGVSAISILRNPLALLNRLDDIAQDIENLQMSDEVWRILDQVARSHGATQELSIRLRRVACSYCDTANPVGQPRCIACGAPLGSNQPVTCNQCGFVLHVKEAACPQCGKRR